MNRLIFRLSSFALASALFLCPTLGQGDTDSRLEAFLVEQRAASGALNAVQLLEGNQLLDEISIRVMKSPELENKRYLNLLKIVGRARVRQWRGLSTGQGLRAEERFSYRILGSLRLRTSEAFREHLQNEVLFFPHLYDTDLRAGAAILLGGIDDESSTLALLNATRDSDRDVRDCAAEAVIGRDSPVVHSAFLRLFIAVEAGELELTTIPLERHFQTISPKEGSSAETRLIEYVLERLTANDWQTSSRAISVSKKLTDHHIAPFLIEAMSVWLSRKSAGLQAARVLGELERELSRRSGLKLGQRPVRWRTWWRSVKADRVAPAHDSASTAHTQASFFGLKPSTDRVIFVLDGSGSMDSVFANGSTESAARQNTRFKEATAQLVSCLEGLGEDTYFDVIVFNSRVRRFRGELVPTKESTLKALKAWIQRKPPEGGTHLKSGVMDAINRSGKAAFEADTIIVLCDGETVEGPGWVAPFIRSFNEKARITFSAVQLGGRSDGALEALCEHTNGDYVEIRDGR